MVTPHATPSLNTMTTHVCTPMHAHTHYPRMLMCTRPCTPAHLHHHTPSHTLARPPTHGLAHSLMASAIHSTGDGPRNTWDRGWHETTQATSGVAHSPDDRQCNDPSRHPYFFLDKSPCRLP